MTGSGTGFVDSSTGAPTAPFSETTGAPFAPSSYDPVFSEYPWEVDPYGALMTQPSTYDVPPVQVPSF